MGLLDDAASAVSGRSSHSKPHHKHHSSSRHSSDHKHKQHRSRSRSSSRSRHNHRSSSHLPGIAASIFGGDDKHHKHNYSRASFFGLGNHANASSRSFFGFGRCSLL
jgi:hypothetical protein